MTLITQALNAALLHFIWQGTMVAFLLWITLSMLRNRTANARYLASCAALALMAALPAMTAWTLYQHPGATKIPVAISTAVPAAIPDAARIARESTPLEWIALWRQWALPLWSVGVLALALRLVLGCRHVASLRAWAFGSGHAMEVVTRLALRMRVRGAIRVLVSTAAECPSVVGWLRPVILLPAATLAGLEPEQLEAVLAHEIAHIRRHDYLVNVTQTMVETLLFYHPAVWWVSARIRHERELCCDDAAVAVCGDAIFYARALTTLERLRGTMPRLALGSAGGSLLYRIQRLAGGQPELGTSKLPGVLALAMGLACFAATVHWAKAQQTMQQQAVPEEWGITVSSTGEVLRRDRVPYPEAISQNGIQGTVELEATLDRSGNVADAHVLSGPPELRKTALQSVLQWQFANGIGGETQRVSITFQQDARALARQHSQDEQIRASATITGQQNAEMRVRQARDAESFLRDELKAAQERGDSRATQDLEEKLNAVAQATALEVRNHALEDQMAQQLAEARKTYGDRNPKVVTLLREILELQGRNLALEDLAAQGKGAEQERNQQIAAQLAALKNLAAEVEERKRIEEARATQTKRAQTEQTQQFLEMERDRLTQLLVELRQRYTEDYPEVKMLRAQVDALRKKTERASVVSVIGAPLARIEIGEMPPDLREALAASLTVRIGDVLSQESMDSVIAAVHQVDQGVECRFQRAENGDVVLRISTAR